MPSRRPKSVVVNERISAAQKARTRLACTLCRSRRIKCDGQPGMCGRCRLDERPDCRYENVGAAERIAGRQRKRALRKKLESGDDTQIGTGHQYHHHSELPTIGRNRAATMSGSGNSYEWSPLLSTTPSPLENSYQQLSLTPHSSHSSLQQQQQQQMLSHRHTFHVSPHASHAKPAQQQQQQQSFFNGDRSRASPLQLQVPTGLPSMRRPSVVTAHSTHSSTTREDNTTSWPSPYLTPYTSSTSSTASSMIPMPPPLSNDSTSGNMTRSAHNHKGLSSLGSSGAATYPSVLSPIHFSSSGTHSGVNYTPTIANDVMPPTSLMHEDEDFTSIEAFWRVSDWQYRCNGPPPSSSSSSSSHFGPDHTLAAAPMSTSLPASLILSSRYSDQFS